MISAKSGCGMGGAGSGNFYRFSAKTKVEDYRSIDVRRWAREGFLRSGNAFNWQWSVDGEKVASINVRVETGSLRLVYRSRSYGEEWEDLDYRVELPRTRCNFGGERVWFICPARGCNRRVAKLYGGRIFACRHCHNLAYSSQRESPGQRGVRKAEAINAKLGWRYNVFDGIGPRPKGMHHRTYAKLCARYDDFMRTQEAELVEMLARIGGKL